MTTVMLDQLAPDFVLQATQGGVVHLADLRGMPVVLYFYPKDCTSGCTREGQDFRDAYEQFSAHNAVIFGISRDSLKLHQKFKAEHQFPFELLSDTAETVCQLYGVIKKKVMYGKAAQGIERSTFLIDTEGILRRQWRGVKVPGHVAEVLEALVTL